MNDRPHALYRFYNAAGALLYVGITNHLPRRMQRHSEDKAWWYEVARITIEMHPDRAAVLDAETAAIQAEKPLYNIRKTSPRHAPSASHKPRTPTRPGERQWTFASLRSGYQRTCDLFLYPELDCSSCVDESDEEDGEAQLRYYVGYLKRNYPHWLEADSVPIYWSVRSDSEGVFETAPFQHHTNESDFLTFFTWPRDGRTGELLDWYQLDVRLDRFPELAAALGWKPSPLQPSAPLASILHSRSGRYPRSVRTGMSAAL